MVLTHHDAIAAFLAQGPSGSGDGPAPLSAALDHIATCFDCWRVVLDLASATGTLSPAEVARAGEAFACERVREEMDTLADVSAAEMRAAFPDLAEHLSHCRSCAGLLSDLRAFRADLVSGRLPALDALPAWREVTRDDRPVRELVGTVLVELRRGLASLVELPAACIPLPAALAQPVRAATTDAREPGAVVTSGFRIDLPGQQAQLEVVVTHAHEKGHVELRVTLVALAAQRLLGRLTSRSSPGQLLAAGTIHAEQPMVVASLPRGEYRLEVTDLSTDLAHEIQLTVQQVT